MIIKIVPGLMKRAKIEGVNRKLYLFETLIKSVGVYGVEIWVWVERLEIENVQGAFIKMIMGGLKKYPRLLFMGKIKMASTALKQMLKFIVSIERMKPERWLKIC